jgi:hypothetical protein
MSKERELLFRWYKGAQDAMVSLLHNTDAISLVGVTPIPTSFA